VRTVTTIYPDSSLIEDAAMHISRFIGSENHNLRYLGVNSLAAIVQVSLYSYLFIMSKCLVSAFIIEVCHL
jgi:hypothetical protein